MQVLNDGYELIQDCLTPKQLQSINGDIKAIKFPAKVAGIRNAEKKFPFIYEIAHSEKLLSLTKQYLPDAPNLVRAIIFNKTPVNNWLVPWHQDRTVAVSKKFENVEWGPWSVKDNVIHVQPPLYVLNQMVTIRIHIDETTQSNGCLKVLPKSHQLGILDQKAIEECAKTATPVFCQTQAGGALIMRPHLVHSSSKASSPSQRRVLHLEYSSYTLPNYVEWA